MELTEFLDIVKQAGPYVFAVLWWIERSDRKKAEERERGISRDYLKSTIKQTNAVRSLRYFLLHGRAPADEEYEAEDVE